MSKGIVKVSSGQNIKIITFHYQGINVLNKDKNNHKDQKTLKDKI